jgi:hypothetical protein
VDIKSKKKKSISAKNLLEKVKEKHLFPNSNKNYIQDSNKEHKIKKIFYKKIIFDAERCKKVFNK